MRLTLNHQYTSNGSLMCADDVRKAVEFGIDNPSDAIIPAETSLYRVADRHVAQYPEAAHASPWWATDYHFNSVLWAPDPADMANAGRAAFAIHPAWPSDCSRYASIVTTTDLSVWYGLGRIVNLPDPITNAMLPVHPSANVLQIYIPGFPANHKKWAKYAKVIRFEAAHSNGRGFQGNMPLGLRPGSV